MNNQCYEFLLKYGLTLDLSLSALTYSGSLDLLFKDCIRRSLLCKGCVSRMRNKKNYGSGRGGVVLALTDRSYTTPARRARQGGRRW